MQRSPLVVAILHSNEADKNYQLYCQAYGLEMQINNDSNAEAVLLAPHGHLAAVTKDTGVTGPDTAIVSAGITDLPVGPGGKPDPSLIKDERNSWLLIAGPGNPDEEVTIRAKLRAGLGAGCRLVLIRVSCLQGCQESSRRRPRRVLRRELRLGV